MKSPRRIVLVLVALAACYVLFEVLLGLAIQWRTTRGGASQADLGLRIHPAPYTMSELRADPAARNPVCVINEQGFRHPVLVTREKSKPRVFVLGGSFAFGAGGSRESDYYLAHIRRAFPDVEFVNAAGSSFVARQQLVHLALDVMPLQPDGLLIIDGFNDLALPMAFGQAPGAPWQWREYEQILSGRTWGILRGYYEARSQLYRVISRLRTTKRATGADFRDRVFPAICSQYAEATATTYALARERGIPVYHVFQPQLAVGKTPSAEEAGMSLPALSEGMRALYPPFAGVARGVAESNNVPFLSLLGIYSNVAEQIYVDYCHVNDRGQKMAGDAIAEFLADNGLSARLQARD